MSPCKSAVKKTAKCPRYSPDSFRNDDANMAYIDHYKNASIILERRVDIESLKETFIPEVFKERTWTKLLNPMGDAYDCIIKEFFANAIVEGEHTNCWVRRREFTISRDSIQELLEIRPTTLHTSLYYDERKEKLEPFVQVHKEEKFKANFTILVMSLTSRERVKIPSGLPVMQREEPINEQTIIQSKAHIPGQSTGVSQIPRDEAVEERGNTDEEIDHFTSIPEDTPQPSSQA